MVFRQAAACLFLFLVSKAVAFAPRLACNRNRRKPHHAPSTYTPTTLDAMQLWLDACSVCPSSPDRVNDADTVLVPEEDPSSVLPFPSSTPTFLRRDDRLIQGRSVVGTVVHIDNDSGQDGALAAVGSVEWILIICRGDWRMIPAENLIAAARGAGTKLAFVVDRAEDVTGLSRALELGVDALCVAEDASDELWDAASNARSERQSQSDESETSSEAGTPRVVSGKCWRMQNTVLADRVCVDLVRSLSPCEGCWLGSSAKTMALILSEAATSSFVPSRPFRVNAGPVHSYILLGDGITTKYLCELQAGDEVLVCNAETQNTRSVAVGRLKIEVRPCVMVGLQPPTHEDESATDVAQVFLQQAETVRLGKESGSFVRVTELEDGTANFSTKGNNVDISGEQVLLRITSSGTHVGKVYSGKVLER